MLTKLGNILINEKRVETYKNISFYLFLAGIFIFIAFPLFGNRIFITEKQLKNSEIIFNQIKIENFFPNVNQFFREEEEEVNKLDENNFDLLSKIKQIKNNLNPTVNTNKIFSVKT